MKKKKRDNLLETREEEILDYIKEYKTHERISAILLKYILYYLYATDLLQSKRKNELINKSIKYQKQLTKVITPYFIKVISETYSDSTSDKKVVDMLYSKFYLLQDKKLIYQIYDELEDKSVKKQITIITDNFLKKNVSSDLSLTVRLNDLLNDSKDDTAPYTDPETFFVLLLNNQNQYSSEPYDPLDTLIDNKIVVPVTKDFNRFHKNESDNKKNISKKNNKATIIFEKIKEASEEKDIFLKHVKNYSINYDKIEEIHVLNKFQTYDGIFIKNIENKNTYLELQKITKTRYFNFKNLTFPYIVRKKNVAFRLLKSGEIDSSYANMRNIQPGENIDIVGFVIANGNRQMLESKNQKFVLIGYLKNKDLVKKKINGSLKKSLFYKVKSKEVGEEVRGLMFLMKTFITQKINMYKNTYDKTYILKKYAFLYSKWEMDALILEIAKKAGDSASHKSPAFQPPKIDIETRMRVTNTENHKDFKTFSTLRKKKYRESFANDSKVDYKCPHNIEFEYMESRKNDEDFNYEYHLKKLSIEYGVYDEILGTICKKCFKVLDSSNFFIEEKDVNSYDGTNFLMASDFDKYEEDIKYFEEYIFVKFFSILKIQSFNKERSNFKILINNLIELVLFHNSLCKIMQSNNVKSGINEIIDLKNLFVKSDDNQKEIVLYYVNIVFIYILTHNEVLRLFYLDSHCNLDVYKKFISPFLLKLFPKEKTHLNESLMFLVFIVSCFTLKYILKINVSDKKNFNDKLKRMMVHTILILKTILDTSEFSNKHMEHIKRVLLLKLQNIYNQNLYMMSLKLNPKTSFVKKTDSRSIVLQHHLDDKLLKSFSYLLVAETARRPYMQNLVVVLETRKRKYENSILERTLKGKLPEIKETGRFYRNKGAEEKQNTKRHIEFTNIKGETMNQFAKTFSLSTSEDAFFIDYDINGKKYSEGKKIGKNNIFVVSIKKGYEVYSIYIPSLKCYMYFDKNMLFYIGYSLTKESTLKFYDKKAFFLRVESSVQNKLRYMGYPSMHFSFEDDKRLRQDIKKVYFSVNENIKKIAFDIHIMFLFLSRKQSNIEFLLPSEKSKKLLKFVSAVTENDNFRMIYNNEFNFKVISSNYKLDDAVLERKKKDRVYSVDDLLEANTYSNIYIQYIIAGLISLYQNNKREVVKSLLLSVVDVFHDRYMETDAFANVLSNFIIDNYNLSNIIDVNANKVAEDETTLDNDAVSAGENAEEDEADVDMNMEDYDEDEGVDFFNSDE